MDERPPPAGITEGPTRMAWQGPAETLLEVRGLRKSFSGHEVLRGIDLTVTRADVFAIIGPNGCGKSTFLRCLNLLETYQAGQVLLRGQVVSEGRPEGHRP